MHKFLKIWDSLQNSRCQKCDMKQVAYWGHTNIRHHHKNIFSPQRPGAQHVCTPVLVQFSCTPMHIKRGILYICIVLQGIMVTKRSVYYQAVDGSLSKLLQLKLGQPELMAKIGVLLSWQLWNWIMLPTTIWQSHKILKHRHRRDILWQENLRLIHALIVQVYQVGCYIF